MCKIIEIFFGLLFIAMGIMFIVYNLKKQAYKLKTIKLRANPENHYNQLVLYKIDDDLFVKCKLQYHFSTDSVSIEFDNGDCKLVNINLLYPLT